MTRVTLLAALLLAGCATPRVEIPREVFVQVPTACIDQKDRPQKPELLTDQELLALDDYRWAWAMWGDRLERIGYEAQLEAIVEGCSKLK